MKKVIMLLGIALIFLIRMNVVAQEVYRIKGYYQLISKWYEMDIKVEMIRVGSQDKIKVTGYKDTYGDWQNLASVTAEKNYGMSAKEKQFEYNAFVMNNIVLFNLGNSSGISLNDLNQKEKSSYSGAGSLKTNGNDVFIPQKDSPKEKSQDELYMEKMKNDMRNDAYKNISDLENRYRQVKNFPKTIPDGWHKVEIIYKGGVSSRSYSYGEAYVIGNQIHYYVSTNRDYSLITRVLPEGIIQLGKGYYTKTGYNEYSKKVYTDTPTEVYFMEYITDPNSKLNDTENLGSYGFISITKKISSKQPIIIFLKEISAGDGSYVLSNVIPEGLFISEKERAKAKCGDNNVSMASQKIGTYKYLAISFDGATKWEGQITISANDCGTVALSYK